MAQPTITEYTLPTTGSVPQAIAKGPDGNLWIIETSANKIAKVTSSGVVTEYPILTANSGATGITGGPDGNVWFTETSANKIGKITPDGVITEFPLPAVSSRPTSITAGLDGNIWFIEGMGIGRMTTDGSVIQFPFAVSSTSQITGGSDGNVWFTLTDSDEVAKITPSGEVSRHPLLTTKPAGIRLFPRSITQGPDGNLWVAGGGLVWRISAAGIAVPYAVPQVENIAVGPDGNLWFTEPIRSRIARLKSDGTVTEYSGPLAGSITAGPDGNIWFTVPESGKVGKLVVSTAPLDNTLTLSQNSLTFNGSVFGGPPAAQTITVTASQSVSYTASVRLLYSPPWLAISPSGTLNGNQTITVTVNQANMGTQGAHFGFIQLAVGDTTQTVLVTLNLTAAGSGGDIKVSPGALDFSYATQTSAPSPQQILITNVNLLSSIPLIVSYTVSSPSGGNWLKLTRGNSPFPSGSTGTSPMSLGVQVDPTGLTPGVYNASISIAPSGGTTVIVPVKLTVRASPTSVSATPANLSFVYQAGGSPPPAQTVQVSESGPQLPFTVGNGGSSWLSITPTTGTPPATLTVSVWTLGLDPGNYSGAITVALPDIGVFTRVSVALIVLPPESRIQEFPIPTESASAGDITAGPDGNMWFTESYGNKIGRITPDGVITEFVVPPYSSPARITAGPDGNLWFTQRNSNKIGRMTINGLIEEYPIPTPLASPTGITKGPDGNIWFTEGGADKIGRITTAGIIAEYAVPGSGNCCAGIGFIAPGPDGNLWFTETLRNRIGRITASGEITEYDLPAPGSYPTAITAGTDGNLWFTMPGRFRIGRITPQGVITEYTNYSISTPSRITAGPDENLWFTVGEDAIASITTAGVITQYALPRQLAYPLAIASGNDGNIWFTEVNDRFGNRIGRFLLSREAPSITAVVNSASFAAGALAPGEIVTLAGANLGPTVPLGLTLDPNGKVATSLSGVSVSFNGYSAPLIYASATQINCVVPYEIDGATDVLVQVTNSGHSRVQSLKATSVNPGIFTANGSGTGTAAASNSTGSYNSPENPAPAGSTITFYLTGEGQTKPRGQTGEVTTVNPSSDGPITPQPLVTPTVTVGGVPATIAFYGEAPGMVAGVMQLNVQIPAGLPSGPVPLVVSFAGVSTQSGVTLSVR